MITDLHTHSYYSDGVFSPAEVVLKAQKAGVQMLALTDHDTTQGLSEASDTAKKLGIQLVKGVELSATWRGNTIHIVALGIDENNPALQQVLEYHQQLREQRAQNIAIFLEKKKVENPLEKVKELAPFMITRTHFARMLVAEKVCFTMNEVFRKYLSDENKTVQTNWRDMADIIRIIKDAKGVSVLAHPLRYKISKAQLKVLVQEFSQANGTGIEHITARTNDNQINYIMGLAHQNNLFLSSGSDFHGDNKFVSIGGIKHLNHPHNIWQQL